MRKFIAVVLAGLVILSTGACAKQFERFNDAERGTNNDSPADIVSFPDGFSSIATKCDNGNRLYVLFKGDQSYGAVTVVPNDESCD